MLFEIYETFKVKIAELYKLGVVDKLYSNESLEFGYNDSIFESLV